jgi:hypothetical protein
VLIGLISDFASGFCLDVALIDAASDELSMYDCLRFFDSLAVSLMSCFISWLLEIDASAFLSLSSYSFFNCVTCFCGTS